MTVRRRNPNLYVLTGGPSTGKTTLIEALQVAGYPTVHEIAPKEFIILS